jgi:hypothetical protein
MEWQSGTSWVFDKAYDSSREAMADWRDLWDKHGWRIVRVKITEHPVKIVKGPRK